MFNVTAIHNTVAENREPHKLGKLCCWSVIVQALVQKVINFPDYIRGWLSTNGWLSTIGAQPASLGPIYNGISKLEFPETHDPRGIPYLCILVIRHLGRKWAL